MIQTLWFFVQIAAVIGAAVWLGTQDGNVTMNFMGYSFTSQIGVFFLALVAVVLSVLFIYRCVRAVFSVPGALVAYHEKDKRKRGWRALTRGLVAVAAGDIKKATQYSKQTDSLLPKENGLPILLAAQAARMRGEEGVAKNRFEELMKDKDAAFLGIRGLLKSALDEGNYRVALEHARTALKLHPKQAWIEKTVYALEIKNHLWSDVLETGKRALKINALSEKRILRDRAAIFIMRSDFEFSKNNEKTGFKELQAAYKIDNAFPPSVTRMADYYLSKGKNRKAASIIEKAWRIQPHPDYTKIWDALAPSKNGKNAEKILKWYEDLVSFKPASVEAQIAAAQAAMDLNFWGEAKAYLMVAEKIYPSARVYRLQAIVEQNSTHNEDAMSKLMDKAAEALPDKAWVCKQTGQTYDEWAAIALPHESFNTIIWDVPGARRLSEDVLPTRQHSALLIDPAN